MDEKTVSYGAGKSDCPICGGLGYIRYEVPLDDPRFGKIFDCECRHGQIQAERREWLRKMGGLDNLQNKTFESFNPEGIGLLPQHQNTLKWAYNTALQFAQNPEGWLIIRGGYGCGKTHLAAAIANYRIERGEKVIFVTVPDLLDYLRSSFAPVENDEISGSYTSRFDEVRTSPVLVLDDLGIESPTPWAVEKLYQILNYRYNAKLPTVITTNHDLEDLELRLRSRLQDQEITQVIPITAPDYRRAGVASNQSDLNALGLYKHLTFDNFLMRQELAINERENLRRAFQTAREFAQAPKGWLTIFGGYASGKTHLAAAVANEVANRGEAVLFITAPDLLDHLRSTFSPSSTNAYDKHFNEVRSARFLILDDLSTRSATAWAKEKLQQIINYRHAAETPTLITTSEMLEDIDQRIATRLRDKRISRMIALQIPPFTG